MYRNLYFFFGKDVQKLFTCITTYVQIATSREQSTIQIICGKKMILKDQLVNKWIIIQNFKIQVLFVKPTLILIFHTIGKELDVKKRKNQMLKVYYPIVNLFYKNTKDLQK